MRMKLGKATVMIAVLLLTIALMVNLPTVKASGIIYIRADSSIDPPTAPRWRELGILSVPPPTEWSKTYGGARYDLAFSVVQTSDGGYALAGTTASYGAGSEDFWLVKVAAEDSDGDGLLDPWERNGNDINRDGTIDLNLPALGANWRHKDIFVEVDYMKHHRPVANAINDVINAFANAPVSNPDVINGITLPVIVNEEMPHQDNIQVWSDVDTIT